ncbi:MAG: hypothetical protein C5B58_09805 [Acidobacteria bacterium]|nr:MAG: hypothetical protein C5B58_09805 [Acidobacteriota bacterium]
MSRNPSSGQRLKLFLGLTGPLPPDQQSTLALSTNGQMLKILAFVVEASFHDPGSILLLPPFCEPEPSFERWQLFWVTLRRCGPRNPAPSW